MINLKMICFKHFVRIVGLFPGTHGSLLSQKSLISESCIFYPPSQMFLFFYFPEKFVKKSLGELGSKNLKKEKRGAEYFQSNARLHVIL